MKDETVIVKSDNFNKSQLQVIIQTVRIFEKCIKENPSQKPTCNQELYIRDISFLLDRLSEAYDLIEYFEKKLEKGEE